MTEEIQERKQKHKKIKKFSEENHLIKQSQAKRKYSLTYFSLDDFFSLCVSLPIDYLVSLIKKI